MIRKVAVVFAVLSLLSIFGCNPAEHTKTEANQSVGSGASDPNASPVAPGDNSGIRPMGGVGMGAGGLAPVEGAESVQGGGGGGVGMAAKERARETAAGGGSSANQMPADDN